MESSAIVKELMLTKDFLIQVFKHPLLSFYNQAYGDLLSDSFDRGDTLPKFFFSGYTGQKFNSNEDIHEFLREFYKLLHLSGIEADKADQLLFFCYFSFDKEDEDTYLNHQRNNLRDLSKVVGELSEIPLTTLKPEGERVYWVGSTDTKDQDRVVKITDEWLLANRDHQVPPSFIYESISANYGKHKIHLPKDVNIKISVGGKEITLPIYYNQEIIQGIVNLVCDKHQAANTDFHIEMQKDTLDLNKLNVIFNQPTKKHIGINNQLFRVAKITYDYLGDNFAEWSAYKKYDFIFRYFCLLKAYPVIKGDVFLAMPERYSDLTSHYRTLGKSRDTIKKILQQTRIQ